MRTISPVRRACARLLEDWIELWLPIWPERAASVLEAGIKALTLAKERTTSGAGNVVASLMDPFGFRKLEEVFDQRVASALERLGVPSARSLADLVERMEKLCERVEQLEAARRKK